MILHVCDSYVPRLGGIELHVRDLVARQRALGQQAMVATLTADPQSSDDSVVRLPNMGILPHPKALLELGRLIGGGAVELVHVHSSVISPLAWSAARAGERAGIPTVLTMHSMLPSGPAARLARTFAPAPPPGLTWTAVSTAAASSLRQVFPKLQVSVLPNGIDPAAWAPTGDPAARPELTLVSVMRTAHRKRPLPLLRILDSVRRSVPDSVRLQAVIAGSGPLDKVIHRRLAASGMDRWVTHAGRLTRPQIRDLLGRADLYLAPATLESFGIAALEARCAGLPVVGMSRSGLSDFIRHGTEGLLVGSDAEMASATAGLLRDARALRTMQRHNREHPPATTWSSVLELHRATYAAAGAKVVVPSSALTSVTT